MGLWLNTDLLLRIVSLTERWPLSAVATCVLRAHDPLARSTQDILKLLPLLTAFLSYRSSVRVVSNAVAESRKSDVQVVILVKDKQTG